jgi:hypothetical protein
MSEQGFQYHKIDKIERVEQITSQIPEVTDIASTDAATATTKTKFEEAVARADTKWDVAAKNPSTLVAAAEETVSKPGILSESSLVEHKVSKIGPANPDQIIAQAQELKTKLSVPINTITEAQNRPTPVSINPANEAILTDKLIHVESHLKTALSKVGVEVQAKDLPVGGQKPLVKFLNYLTNSDAQLSTLMGEINGMSTTSKEGLRPDVLLALQIKLGFIQSEVEFFTNVLNKAVEGIKTTMNVQV